MLWLGKRHVTVYFLPAVHINHLLARSYPEWLAVVLVGEIARLVDCQVVRVHWSWPGFCGGVLASAALHLSCLLAHN